MNDAVKGLSTKIVGKRCNQMKSSAEDNQTPLAQERYPWIT